MGLLRLPREGETNHKGADGAPLPGVRRHGQVLARGPQPRVPPGRAEGDHELRGATPSQAIGTVVLAEFWGTGECTFLCHLFVT